MYDTGSSNLWVPDEKCTTLPACADDSKFYSSKSSTYAAIVPQKDYFLPYGSGVCAGFLGNDTVTVGDAAAVSYTFGQTTLVSFEGSLCAWRRSCCCGILSHTRTTPCCCGVLSHTRTRTPQLPGDDFEPPCVALLGGRVM